MKKNITLALLLTVDYHKPAFGRWRCKFDLVQQFKMEDQE
jgi:hypothetical protein